MADTPRRPDLPDLPEAVAAKPSRWSFQLVWVIPLVAAVIGGWLAVKAIRERGPTITISFETAEGLEAGKTKIKYKEVEIGLVKSVTLSRDTTRVIATADLVKDAEPYLVEDARFWVVRPRVSGGGISGLGTLLSGAYIGMDIGKSGKARRTFVALKVPPVVGADVPGREFVLRSEDVGSLDAGSPVYFRRLQAGQIVSHELDKDGKGITLKVFVNAPYDKYVNANTRFWHASGIDVTLDSSGIRVDTESLTSILLGGIAFQTPADSEQLPPAEANTVFTLFPDRAQAMKTQYRIVDTFALVFKESVRGLSPGASVDFRGVVVGEVVAIHTHFDPVTKELSVPVEIHLYPERFTSRYRSRPAGGRIAKDPKELLQFMVDRGFRAQLRTGNLLTGQLYIALDFFPDAPKVKIDWSESPIELPTVPGGLQELQVTIAEIAQKINQVPFEAIGNDLRRTLQNADKLIQQLDAEVAPEARAALAEARKALSAAERTLDVDSALQQDARDALREIARTARAFRGLADFLERHPESLIRGKKQEEK